MKRHHLRNQSGYVLLLILLALMGIGGVVVAGFTQDAKRQVDHEKYLHNKRVLAEAKQALLQFAYNYPVTNQLGPGRLPCADTDNDGTPNTVIGTCVQLGRLPWNQPNLNLYDIRDADGQRLWYAVSDSFATNVGPNNINSDKLGSITIRDQVGNFIYDATAGEGVAAVIIAPGAITSRNGVVQDRTVGNGDDPFDIAADTDPGIVNPVNYLDLLFGTEDNAQFTHNTANGFMLGRVDDLTSASIIINDQFEVITTAEVIEVAQRATLQAYRDAINIYRANIGVDAYPWLDDYSTTLLSVYDADVNTRLGRVPSIFSNYFTPIPQASQPITSDLEMTGVRPLVVNGFPVPIFDPGVISANASIVFNTAGDLIITPAVNGASIVRYYWDEQAVPNGWQECLPVVFGTERDCNQADLGGGVCSGVPDSSINPNQCGTRVVRVTYANNLVAGTPFTRAFAGNAGLDPVYQAPTATDHARVYFEYSEAFLDEIGVDFKYDNNYHLSFDDVQLGNVNYQLGVVYYPELPNWALATQDNWHDSVQFAFSGGYQPGAVGACGGVNPPCLTVNNVGGITTDKIAVLTLAADHNLVDEAFDGYTNDLGDIFEGENINPIVDDIFDIRPPGGNDEILVVR